MCTTVKIPPLQGFRITELFISIIIAPLRGSDELQFGMQNSLPQRFVLFHFTKKNLTKKKIQKIQTENPKFE
jgi:hypothetical protein